ncbi:putative dual-specificity RNA methyltransferase RlmN [Spirochaetia bacterium]|nr:putative dual-specificity RNA methyltransferase RlmN [Spirochaetia bacterium]
MPPELFLSGLSPEELLDVLSPLPAFRANQIFKWISGGVSSFDDMTDLSLSLRRELSGRFGIYSSTVDGRFGDASDSGNAEKISLRLRDGAMVEAVLLSDGFSGRKTACLSTQAGCPAGCVFCKTGSLGFLRNLDSSEIVEQFFYLKAIAGGGIDNIVVMGMGEPLLNLGELRRALRVITHKKGLNFSKRRITVSTCGIAEGIRDLADKGPGVRLALSLCTAREDLRLRLMPLARQNPLPRLKDALSYHQKKNGQRITLEAVLLGNVNTTREDAAALVSFVRGLDAVVNLIPWNPVEGLSFEGKPLREPGEKEIKDFEKNLENGGVKFTRRRRKGGEVGGACGQLGSLGGGAKKEEFL